MEKSHSTRRLVFSRRPVQLGGGALDRLELDRACVFPALVPGGEGLDGVGLELVVAAEGGVEAVETGRFGLGDGVDQFLGDFARQAYEDQAVRYRTDRDSGHFDGRNLFRRRNARLEEDFREEVVLGSGRIDVVRVQFELDGDLVFRGVRRQLLPAFEIRGP